MKAIVVTLILSAPAFASDPELTPLVAPSNGNPANCAGYYRTSMYDRWQYYSVDRAGQFRPRVVMDFPEPFYMVNGRPYPLMSVLPMTVIPHIQ